MQENSNTCRFAAGLFPFTGWATLSICLCIVHYPEVISVTESVVEESILEAMILADHFIHQQVLLVVQL